METYHKIETLFKFDQEANNWDYKTFKNEDVELLKYNDWVFTEKVDGTNIRLYWDGYTLQYGGRTDRTQFSEPQKAWLEETLVTEELETLIEQLFGGNEVYIFGEMFGKNIQKVAKLYSDDYQFRVFDIKINNVYLPRREVDVLDEVLIVCNELGLTPVPVLLTGNISDGLNYVFDNKKSSFSEAPLEGLVGTPLGGFLDRRGKRIIVKIKERDTRWKVK